MGLAICELTMCAEHYEQLSHQLDTRGLLGVSSVTADELHAKVLLTLVTGEITRDTYDPRMHAYGMVMLSLTTEAVERGILDPEAFEGAESPLCVICLFDAHHRRNCEDERCELRTKSAAAIFFEPVADYVLSYATRHGVVTVPGA